MASYNENGRGRGPGRRSNLNGRRLAIEALEGRTLLTGDVVPRPWLTNNNLADTQNGPMANAGGALIKAYFEYQQYLPVRTQTSEFASSPLNSQSGTYLFEGDQVRVDVKVFGDLRQGSSDLALAGLTIRAMDSTLNLVEGLVPVSQLPAIAALPNVVNVAPIAKPQLRQQGLANNQAEQALFVDAARTQYGVNGTGIKVGVISDSVNQAANPYGPAGRPPGIAGSIQTGDLPASGVTIIQDGGPGGTDEGRAMLEQIYDLAPGAQLYFATANGGPVNFANNIRALAAAGCTVIVDDIGYANEPFFQDGVISQAIQDVARQGVVYVSAAGNSAANGYGSPVFGVGTTTVGGVNGRFVNFNPSGTTYQMPMTMAGNGSVLFQFDQPFGSANPTAVTSNVDILFFDSGNNLVGRGGVNTIASQQPYQFPSVPATATSFAVQVISGPDIGHIQVVEWSGGFTPSRQFGNAGGITYPTTFGHSATTNMIGVGAVPWFGTAPVATPSPVLSEDFSSFGPVQYFFDALGNRLPNSQVLYKPDMSGTDANNTSFFGSPPGSVPAGLPTNNYSLPNFYGTSSAAPNLASVAILMRQLAPNASPADITKALMTSALATPLNPTVSWAPKLTTSVGTWDPQGGYGLINAPRALAAIDQMRVITATPGQGAVMNALPTTIDVSYTFPVNPATALPGNIQVTGPAGTTVTVTGASVDANNPAIVHYSISVSVAAGSLANGAYTLNVLAGGVRSTDGKVLQPLAAGSPYAYTTTFRVNDVIAPTILNTTFNSRTVTVQFSEPVQAATINATNITLVNPSGVLLNADPRLSVTYDASRNQAIIDLTNLPQTLLLSGTYVLTVSDAVKDLVGNSLDGEFFPNKNVFPSGNGTAGGVFVQHFNATLRAPIIASLTLEQTSVSDTGILGDMNTQNARPWFTGNVRSVFPQATSGLLVAVSFSGLHGGTSDLGLGFGGRGFVGTNDLGSTVVTTDANGNFRFQAPTNLAEGYQFVRIVVVGASDIDTLPGYSATLDARFRTDYTSPQITGVGPTPPQTTNALQSITLLVNDPSVPGTGSLATPLTVSYPALDPATVANLSNYRLLNLTTNQDLSAYIQSATFVPGPARVTTSSPFTGQVLVSITPGLPAGQYQFTAFTGATTAGGSGIRDAAGNPIDGDPTTPGLQDFTYIYNLQSEPVYITGVQAAVPNPTTVGGYDLYTRAGQYFELPAPGQSSEVPAPPSEFRINFSNHLVNRDYTGAVQLLRTADPVPNSVSDGSFGVGSATSYSTVAGLTITLYDTTTGLKQGDPGFVSGDQLRVTLPTGFQLAPDRYRLYIPNTLASPIKDVFGNWLDGEFTGNLSADGNSYENLLSTGVVRPNDMSGDGAQGGAFQIGYIVVPHGNVIYARPDAIDNFQTGNTPDGSIDRPYAALAPEGSTAYTFASGPFAGQVNYNDPRNYGTGFVPANDRNNDGVFQQSAFFAAQMAALNGPVVIVALPSQVDPTRTFVLAPGIGGNPLTRDGSASVPYNTTLVLTAGTILKMKNASLFVQNQGSSVEVLGGPNPGDQVIITSLADDTAGGDTNGDGISTTPAPGDYGGIVIRNFDQRNRSQSFPIDGRLKGAYVLNPVDNTYAFADAEGGADEGTTILDHLQVRYGGGAVPQTYGTRYDSITAYNSRFQLSNAQISMSGTGTANTGGQAAISGDLDSFREDDLYRGPTIRNTTLTGNSINGIQIRALPQTGMIEQTNAQKFVSQPAAAGADRIFTLANPLPYVLTAPMLVGEAYSFDNQSRSAVVNRLYVQPGMLVKSVPGVTIGAINTGASINVGDRTYIKQYDLNNAITPNTPGFQYNPHSARPVFTSIYDDDAFTQYVDPVTLLARTIVAAGDTNNDGGASKLIPGQAVPLNKRWGGIEIQAGSKAVIDQADFRFGGGAANGPARTIQSQSVLAFTMQSQLSAFTNAAPAGAFVMVTDNNFNDNFDAAMQIAPNGLLAADPLTPLTSGHPFFRRNVMVNNDINGLAVVTSRGYDTVNFARPTEGVMPNGSSNQTVSATWDSTDLTYVVRGSIVVSGYSQFNAPMPDATTYGTVLAPRNVLTIQSAVPGALLADGSSVSSSGESVIVKLANDFTPNGAGAINVTGSTGDGASVNVGAGFVVGVDDNLDPTAPSPLIDPGWNSQIRILGYGGNQTNGQKRVPVIITSLRDGTAGTTVRGVNMYDIYRRDPLRPNANLTTPAAGDGGYVYIGGNSLTDPNLLDPRDGSVIDNADIRYMTRIELQGGGIVDAADLTGDNNIDINDNWRTQKLGIDDPRNQFNSAMAFAITNSNLSSMADAAVYAHPDAGNALIRNVGDNVASNTPPGGVFRSGVRGQPYVLFMYNNTISNSPLGVAAFSEVGDNTTGQSPESVVLLNNTFYNNGTALQTVAPQYNGLNSLSHVYWTAMNNIFANSSTAAVQATGQQRGSQLQYNLFSGNGRDIIVTGDDGSFGANNGALFGPPDFISGGTGDFRLGAGSLAIDAARSEIGPLAAGDALYPISIINPNGTRGVRNTVGRTNPIGGLARTVTNPNDLVTLPGSGARPFIDQWVAVAPGSYGAVKGPLTDSTGGYWFMPLQGERDQIGNFRQDAAGVPNIGFGSKPFFDIGAFEYLEVKPPKITAVTTIVNPGDSPKDLYVAGGIGGTNKTPQTISVTFNKRIDPTTITALSVLLVGAGPDQQLGTSDDTKFNLSGKLSFTAATNTMVINVAASGLTLPNDVYQLRILGDGANVVRDTDGNSLDGENLDANGVQKPLPSGDGFPGGNFLMTFIVNSNHPTIVAGSIRLDPNSDTGVPNDNITYLTTPNIIGQITDSFPPANARAGQTVRIRYAPDGVHFDDSYTVTGTTDAQGRFSLAPAKPLPNSPVNVGPDGILGTADDLGFSVAQIVVTNSAGNSADPYYMKLWIDTVNPRVTGYAPAANSVNLPVVVNNVRVVPISFTLNENTDPASLLQGIAISRSGGDGTFGEANDVTGISFDTPVVTYLGGTSGAVRVNFNIIDATGGLPNDVYRVTLRSTAPAVTDRAGNPIDGAGTGGPSDFVFDFTVYDPARAQIFYVDGGATTTTQDGRRGTPYHTIQAAIDAAPIGSVVAVLPPSGNAPGTAPRDYTESLVMKSYIRLVSADPTSTDSSWIKGDALNTVIRAASGANPVTIRGTNLYSGLGLDTEISGFTIASPLIGPQYTGPINVNSIGLLLNNSDVLVRNNYFITSGNGGAIQVNASGSAAAAPRILSNVIAGNLTGIYVDASGVSAYRTNQPAEIYNNTVVFNTTGLYLNVGSVLAADVANNIFAYNNDRTAARNGLAINASAPNQTLLRYNLFYDNGPSSTSSADDVSGVGGGFDPGALGATPDALGNFVGDPTFTRARDPRPNFDTWPFFYTDSNFIPQYGSPAIDNALEALAPATDLLGASRVDIPGLGFPGRGPADLGAFEYAGIGGQTLGGQFRVVGSSLVPGFGFVNGGSIGSFRSAPGQITVTFSGKVNRSSILPSDLVLSGTGINPSNPVKATTLTWVDDHTVTFGLTGGFAPGTVNMTIGSGRVTDALGNPIAGYSDSFRLDSTTPVGPNPNPVETNPPLVVGTKRRSIAVQLNRRKTVQRAGLIVSFNEALDSASATDRGAYQVLVGRKVRGKMVYNRPIAVTNVRYNASTNQVLITGAKNLPSGPLRLIVADSVKNAAGNALDGNRDGQPGGAYVVSLR